VDHLREEGKLGAASEIGARDERLVIFKPLPQEKAGAGCRTIRR
jgi:hypothetical protein